MAVSPIDWGKMWHERLMSSPGRQHGKSWFQQQYQQQFIGVDHARGGGSTYSIARRGPNGTIIIDDVVPYETRTGVDARDCSVDWNDHLLGYPDSELPSPHRRKGERRRFGWRFV